MNDNAEHEEHEAAAQQREDAAIERDDAAQMRDDASVTRHQELRQDIEDTQHLVSDGTGEMVFRVEGLQDKFFEHLIFATNAIEDATQALDEESKTRQFQIKLLSAAIVIGIFLGLFTLVNTLHIEDQREHSDEVACLAINENRNTVFEILGDLAARDGVVDPEEEALLTRYRETTLLPLDCEGGIQFTEDPSL